MEGRGKEILANHGNVNPGKNEVSPLSPPFAPADTLDTDLIDRYKSFIIYVLRIFRGNVFGSLNVSRELFVSY